MGHDAKPRTRSGGGVYLDGSPTARPHFQGGYPYGRTRSLVLGQSDTSAICQNDRLRSNQRALVARINRLGSVLSGPRLSILSPSHWTGNRQSRRAARVVAAQRTYNPPEGAGFPGRDRNPRLPFFALASRKRTLRAHVDVLCVAAAWSRVARSSAVSRIRNSADFLSPGGLNGRPR